MKKLTPPRDDVPEELLLNFTPDLKFQENQNFVLDESVKWRRCPPGAGNQA